MTKILIEVKSLYPHHPALDQAQVQAWFNAFGAEDPAQFRNAILAAAKSSKFFPSPGEIQAKLEENLPQTLKMSAQEALVSNLKNSFLIRDAELFAKKLSHRDPYTQYDSLEDLERAESIQKAIYEREFKARFEQKQKLALSYVRQGINPKEAILKALENSAVLPSEGINILKNVQNALSNLSEKQITKKIH